MSNGKFLSPDELVAKVKGELLDIYETGLPQRAEEWIRDHATKKQIYHIFANVSGDRQILRVFLSYTSKEFSETKTLCLETTNDEKVFLPLKALKGVSEKLNEVEKELNALSKAVPNLRGWCVYFTKAINTPSVLIYAVKPKDYFPASGVEALLEYTMVNDQRIKIVVVRLGIYSPIEVKRVANHLEKWLNPKTINEHYNLLAKLVESEKKD